MVGVPGAGLSRHVRDYAAAVTDEIRALLSRHLPGYEVRSLARLGEGWDHVAYEVNAELIVRGSKEADPSARAAGTRREAELLAAVAELSPLPVPAPVFADPEAGVLAYRKLPGLPLLGHPVAEPARLAAPLGEFLSRLHAAPVERMARIVPADDHPPASWREEAEGDYAAIAGHLAAAARRRVEDFLGRTPPADPVAVAFCHNDLGAEHLLVDIEAHTVTGVLDWADAAIADPACDLALLFRDLGPEVFDLVLASYGGRLDDADRERAVFYARCALLEDIAYGLRTGARQYAQAGLAHLGWTFA